MLPPQLGGGPITSITRGVLWMAVGVGLDGAHSTFRLVVASPDEAAARALEKSGRAIADLIAKTPSDPAIPGLIGRLKTEVQGARIVVTGDPETAAGLVSAIIRPAREASTRSGCTNNEKQIALALHNYASAHKGAFPPATTTGKDGKPLLSWRVMILPYLEQDALFKEFHQDEPWDSPHNKALIARMPETYRCPLQAVRSAREGKTRYVGLRGAGTIFRGDQPVGLRDITDGTSNTIFYLDAGDDHAVTWSKPDDLEMPADAAAVKAILERAPHSQRPRHERRLRRRRRAFHPRGDHVRHVQGARDLRRRRGDLVGRPVISEGRAKAPDSSGSSSPLAPDPSPLTKGTRIAYDRRRTGHDPCDGAKSTGGYSNVLRRRRRLSRGQAAADRASHRRPAHRGDRHRDVHEPDTGQPRDRQEAARRDERQPGDGAGAPGCARNGQQDGRRCPPIRRPARGAGQRGRPPPGTQQRRPQEPVCRELPLPPAPRPENDQRVRPARRAGVHHRGPAGQAPERGPARGCARPRDRPRRQPALGPADGQGAARPVPQHGLRRRGQRRRRRRPARPDRRGDGQPGHAAPLQPRGRVRGRPLRPPVHGPGRLRPDRDARRHEHPQGGQQGLAYARDSSPPTPCPRPGSTRSAPS